MVTKVSIVIPTWKRHKLLGECLRNINQQNYTNIEIIVVSDGQEEDHLGLLLNTTLGHSQNIRLIELGRNWSSLLPNSFGIAPLLMGYLAASGDYIMPWCDDERALVPYHIRKLSEILDKFPNVDFVYPQVRIWRNGDPDGPETAIIGTPKPEHGQITHYMFRATNLINYGMPEWSTHPVDIALVEKWMRNGAQWMFLDELTFEHRLDQ